MDALRERAARGKRELSFIALFVTFGRGNFLERLLFHRIAEGSAGARQLAIVLYWAVGFFFIVLVPRWDPDLSLFPKVLFASLGLVYVVLGSWLMASPNIAAMQKLARMEVPS